MNSFNIEISKVRAISEILFEHLESIEVDSIDLTVDYYWNIPEEELYNLNQTPKELNMGQLTDEWQDLQKLLTAEADPISYYFVWLAAILRAIGDTVVH